MNKNNINIREKPFKHDVCSLTLTAVEHIKTHSRIHSGEEPYKCEVCSATLTKAGSLKRQCRIHSEEKPHKCTLCLAIFTEAGHNQTHSRSGHGPGAQFIKNWTKTI